MAGATPTVLVRAATRLGSSARATDSPGITTWSCVRRRGACTATRRAAAHAQLTFHPPVQREDREGHRRPARRGRSRRPRGRSRARPTPAPPRRAGAPSRRGTPAGESATSPSALRARRAGRRTPPARRTRRAPGWSSASAPTARDRLPGSARAGAPAQSRQSAAASRAGGQPDSRGDDRLSRLRPLRIGALVSQPETADDEGRCPVDDHPGVEREGGPERRVAVVEACPSGRS